MRWIFALLTTVALFAIVPLSREGQASDFVIYSIYQELNLGNAQENPKKDFYINMGSLQGVHVGSVLQILRRMPTYDDISQQLYSDVIFPIALVKVIHVETNASVARLDKMLSSEDTPAINPRAVMIGDLVKLSE